MEGGVQRFLIRINKNIMTRVTTEKSIKAEWRELLLELRDWNRAWNEYEGGSDQPQELSQMIDRLYKEYTLIKK